MAKDTISDPIAELRALEARKAVEAEQFKKDQEVAQARVDELYRLQHPLYGLIQQRTTLYGTVKKIQALKDAAVKDAQKLREEFHFNICTYNALEQRAGHFEFHKRLFHAETLPLEYDRSLSLVKAEIENYEHEASTYAEKNNLKAMLPDFTKPPAEE